MNFRPSKQQHGGAMVVVMIFALIAAGLLGTYMIMISHENMLVQRSQTWNNAMTIAEAGVEEALAAVNKNVGNVNGVGGVTNWYVNITSDGWGVDQSATNLTWTYNGVPQTWLAITGAVYHIKRWIDPTNGYYDVYINNSSTNGPEILSIGSANWGNAVTSATNAVRKIYMQTKPVTALVGGIVAVHTITFNGNNVTIDSWDSSTNTHSIWHTNLFYHGYNYGTYSDTLSYNSNSPPSRTANVMVATPATLDAGNANIYGYVDTAPGGTPNVGAQGSVGDLNWVHNGNRGIQNGHSRDDLNETFYSFNLPVPTNASQSTWWPLTSDTNGHVATIGGIRYTNNSGYSIGGYSYPLIITNRSANSNDVYYSYGPSLNQNLFVGASNVVVCLTNGISGNIIMVNTNADVQFWCMGDITFGGVTNATAYTHACSFYDVAGYPISITASGNASGLGYIYAPSSTISFNGGGNNTYDIIGAIFCKDITINGHFNFHFDESLATAVPTDQYITSLWEEVH
jgi:hypothetical protein